MGCHRRTTRENAASPAARVAPTRRRPSSISPSRVTRTAAVPAGAGWSACWAAADSCGWSTPDQPASVCATPRSTRRRTSASGRRSGKSSSVPSSQRSIPGRGSCRGTSTGSDSLTVTEQRPSGAGDHATRGRSASICPSYAASTPASQSSMSGRASFRAGMSRGSDWLTAAEQDSSDGEYRASRGICVRSCPCSYAASTPASQ